MKRRKRNCGLTTKDHEGPRIYWRALRAGPVLSSRRGAEAQRDCSTQPLLGDSAPLREIAFSRVRRTRVSASCNFVALCGFKSRGAA